MRGTPPRSSGPRSVPQPASERARPAAGAAEEWALPDPSAGVCDEAFRPYRHLAVRVLARAFLDLADPARSPSERESARVFLAGSGMLFHWCQVAALNPRCIVSRAEKLTEAPRPARTTPPRIGSPV